MEFLTGVQTDGKLYLVTWEQDEVWVISRRSTFIVDRRFLVIGRLFFAFFLALGGDDGGEHREEDDGGDDNQRGGGWDIVLKPFGLRFTRIDEHFYADEYEDGRQADFEVAEIID